MRGLSWPLHSFPHSSPPACNLERVSHESFTRVHREAPTGSFRTPTHSSYKQGQQGQGPGTEEQKRSPQGKKGPTYLYREMPSTGPGPGGAEHSLLGKGRGLTGNGQDGGDSKASVPGGGNPWGREREEEKCLHRALRKPTHKHKRKTSYSPKSSPMPGLWIHKTLQVILNNRK